MAYVSGLLTGVPSTSRVQIEDVDYLLKVAKVIFGIVSVSFESLKKEQ